MGYVFGDEHGGTRLKMDVPERTVQVLVLPHNKSVAVVDIDDLVLRDRLDAYINHHNEYVWTSGVGDPLDRDAAIRRLFIMALADLGF